MNQDVFCGDCGAKMERDVHFCGQCGSNMDFYLTEKRSSAHQEEGNLAGLKKTGFVDGIKNGRPVVSHYEPNIVPERPPKEIPKTEAKNVSKPPKSPKSSKSTGNKCNVCFGPISMGKVTVDGKNYHPRCFTCKRCGLQLKSVWNIVEGKYYCQECTDKNPQLYKKAKKGGTSDGCIII